jgi:hypothetical protein
MINVRITAHSFKKEKQPPQKTLTPLRSVRGYRSRLTEGKRLHFVPLSEIASEHIIRRR